MLDTALNRPDLVVVRRKAWFGLGVLCLPTFLVSMDFSVLYLAVPRLTADLAPTASQQLWIVDIYGFMIAGFLVTMGSLGDRIGRRRLLLIGAAVFAAASISAACSRSAEALIASRAVLGIAGAAVMPSVLALVTSLFDAPRDRTRALTIYLTCFMSGLTLGPLVGGILLQSLRWGSVFLLAVPGMLVLLVLGPSCLPDQPPTGTARLDPLSVALSLAAVLSLVGGLKELARHGLAPLPVAAVLTGIAAAVLFTTRQRRLPHPLLDLRLFDDRIFRSALTLMFTASIVGTGTLLTVTLFLQSVIGLDPLQSGLLLLIPNLLMIAGNLATAHLVRILRPARLIAIGLLIAAIGYLAFSLTRPDGGPALVVAAVGVALLGTGPLAALSNQLAMNAVPAGKTGSGAAVVQTINELGLGLGVATLATLGTVVYRTQLHGALDSMPAATAAAAQESLERALTAAGALAPVDRTDLIVAARDAFTSGLHAVGWVSALLYLALAVLALAVFREDGPSRTASTASMPDP